MKRLFLLALISSNAFGAASILLTGCAASANGLSVVCTVTGFAGTLTPTTNPTGIRLYDTYRNGFITSSGAGIAIVGSQLTISLDAAVQVAIAANVSATWLEVDVSTCNLTDTAGNTVTGQVDQPITVSTSQAFVPSLSPASTSAAYEGFWIDNSIAKGGLSGQSSDFCYRFNSNTTLIDIVTFQYGGGPFPHWVLYQDGTSGTMIRDWGNSSGTTNYAYAGLVSGLSGTHEYAACQIGSQSSYSAIALVRVSSAASFTGVAPTRKPLVACFGDSIRSYEGLTDSRKGDCWQVAQAMGWADFHTGVSGLRVGGVPGNDMTTLYPPVVNRLNASENLYIADMAWSSGVNDIAAGNTPTQLGTSWTGFMTAMYGTTRWFTNVVTLGLIPELGNSPSTYDPFIQSAVSAFTSPVPKFIRTGSGGQLWVNNVVGDGTCTLGGGDKQVDNIHIQGCNAGTWVGYSKVTARKIPILDGIANGHSYTLSGGSSVNVGNPLTITVSLHAGAAFMGDQSITCTGSGVTVSPSTLTPTLAATAPTMTFTPTSPGLKSVSCTSVQDGWVNPAAYTFTAVSTVVPTWMIP